MVTLWAKSVRNSHLTRWRSVQRITLAISDVQSEVITLFFRDLRAGLRRRWYLALAGSLLTLAAAGAIFQIVPPTYEASASVILVPPSGSVPDGGNPYLFMGGLQTTVDVLSRSLSDEQTRRTLLGGDPTLDYSAEPDRTSAGPILLVKASGPTQEATMTTLETVVALVPTSLTQVQSTLGIAPQAAITSMTLTVDDKAKPVQKTRLRATLAVGAVSGAIALLLIGLIDGLLLRRESRKQRRLDAASAAGPVPAPRPESLPSAFNDIAVQQATVDPVELVLHADGLGPHRPSHVRDAELASSRAGNEPSEP